jgi:hypothetical protein
LRAAFVHAGCIRYALRFEPGARLRNSYDARLEFFADLDGISDVVEVAVRNQHRVHAIDFFERLGRHGIRLNPWIYQNHVTGWSGDPKRGMAEPCEFVSSSLKHLEASEEDKLVWLD